MNLVAAFFLSCLGLAATVLPRRFELFAGPLLGRLGLALDRRRREIALENISRCLPELGPEGREELLRKNFEHYGILAFELAHIFSPIPGHYHRYARSITRVEGLEHWRRAHAKGRGTIMMTAHLANWEVMGVVCKHTTEVMMATRRLKPDWVNAKMEASRHGYGGVTAYGKRILPALIKQLKDGKSIGFVMDQYAPPPMGVPARFFGALVDTQAALSLIVQRTGAAIVPCFQRRDAEGIIHLTFEPEIELTPAQLEDPATTATVLAARVEQWIRANPAQWLWSHRRFKNAVWPAEAAGSR